MKRLSILLIVLLFSAPMPVQAGGGYLMVPSKQGWMDAASYDSADACQFTLNGFREGLKKAVVDPEYRQRMALPDGARLEALIWSFDRGQCMASDDPRLGR